MPEVSIILRSKNEEQWIGHCLSMLFKQSFKDFEVILVDNDSTDRTVQIAKRYPIKEILPISKFMPGKAINDGVRSSSGNFIVCLSAHCIPKGEDWLLNLKSNFNTNDKIAGVYGRQLPLCFTDPIDKRDLMTVFGLDRKIQVKDYFFHNANSMIRRDIWEKFPFDEKVTNIEDRVWGKVVTEAGYHLAYEPEAAVYHYHGINQKNNAQRVRGVVSVLEHVDSSSLDELPASMLPDNINVTAILPVAQNFTSGSRIEALFTKTINELKESKYVNTIFLVTSNAYLSRKMNVGWIDRAKIANVDSVSLTDILSYSLDHIHSESIFPEKLLYANPDYLNRPKDLFDNLICDCLYNGFDSMFSGLVDYGHYWFRNCDGIFTQTEPTLKSREQREPQYKGLYGLGCLTSPWLVKKGKLLGGNIGIFEINDEDFSTRERFA